MIDITILEPTQKRDQIQILLVICHICLTPTKKTDIMYQMRGNFNQLTIYLSITKKYHLIEEIEKYVFLTTSKGREFINLFSDKVIN